MFVLSIIVAGVGGVQMRKWCIWLLILSTTTLLLTACGQKENVYKIGAEGGLIQSEAHGVSLAVAPNSVEGTTKIGIEPMNEPDALVTIR